MKNYIVHDPVVMLNDYLINIGEGSRIDSFVKLEGGRGLWIGKYVHIASFAHIGIGGGRTIIDDYANVSSGGKVISGTNLIDWPSMSAVAPEDTMRIERMKVKLKKYSAVMTNGIVLPGVTLHEGAILAAGGVATQDIPEWEVWGGVPARFIKMRPRVRQEVV